MHAAYLHALTAFSTMPESPISVIHTGDRKMAARPDHALCMPHATLRMRCTTYPRCCDQPEWTVNEVHDFLEMCRPKLGAKVDVYKQLMQDQDIDGEVLFDMGDDELNK
jgi:hypothetical protein